MSNIVENNIVLDLNRSAIQTIYAKQYDNNTREIKIEIVNQGKHVNIKSLGYAVYFKGVTSTGKQLLNRCEVDNDDIIHLELTSTILHDNGHLNGEIILLDSNSGSIDPETSIITGADVISTMPFILHVKSSAFEDGDVSEEEYSALNDLIATVVHLEDEVEDNEEERQSNEQERISNENVRKSNENTRIANENTRISNENTRKSNETTRQSNEQTRQRNENTRQTNETSRIETMERIETDLQTLEDELDTVVLKRQLGVPSTSTETGVATLDTNGQVPESQLPSYVDDVLEGRAQNVTQSASGAYSATAFILKGESTACVPEEDKIYIDTTDLIQYRWSGSVFVSVGSHLALGETSSTAFPGNRGKAAENAIDELDANKMTWGANSILGVKNLLTFPYYTKTTTVNGVTFTVNDDETITVNGTSTADAVFTLANYRSYDGNETLWNKIVESSSGKFRLTGCPSGGSSDTYYLQIGGGIEGHTTWWGGGKDTGNGLTFSANIDENKFYIYVCRIVIEEGCSCDNLVFKPMLRDAADIDETFRPYAMTNKELTTPTFTQASTRANINSGETILTIFGKIKKFFADLKTVAFTGNASDVSFTSTTDLSATNVQNAIEELETDKMTWEANSVLGAKNLIPYPYYETSHSDNGITFTDNGDGTVTANGTAEATAIFLCRYRETHNLKAGTYRISGCPENGSRTSYYQWLGIWDGSTNVYGVYDTGNGVNAVITEEYEDYYLVVGCYVYAGQTVSNLTFYPMLRLASDTDSTYQPYAMTNKELTDNLNTTHGNYYGTCETLSTTAAKEVTVNEDFKLEVGTTVTVKFTNTNIASNCTLNVNGTGAKQCWWNSAVAGSGSLFGVAGRYIKYMYDGTYWVFVGWSVDNGVTEPYQLGFGYGTCETAESTIAKIVTLENYALKNGGYVSVKFTKAVPAGATMNINSKGAKPIYYQGSNITEGIIKAGDIATFIYNGSQYVLTSIDRGTGGSNASDISYDNSISGLTATNVQDAIDEYYVTSTWNEKIWTGLTNFLSSYIWTDGENIYYSKNDLHYILDKSTSTWNTKTWNGLTNFYGDFIWTDGENIYYSNSGENYVLDKSTSTWNEKTWDGLTLFDGDSIWTDGENIYYSYPGENYVLDKSTSTWNEKTWNNYTDLVGSYIWTDGENIYFSYDRTQYVLDKSTSTWNTKTWNGYTRFLGQDIWTDGENIYCSFGKKQYVLDKTTSTWNTKTWNGLTDLAGVCIWTDGVNIYYSNNTSQKVLLQSQKGTLKQVKEKVDLLKPVAFTGSYNDLADKPEHTEGKPDHFYATKDDMLADIANIGDGEMAYTGEDASDLLTRVENIEQDVNDAQDDIAQLNNDVSVQDLTSQLEYRYCRSADARNRLLRIGNLMIYHICLITTSQVTNNTMDFVKIPSNLLPSTNAMTVGWTNNGEANYAKYSLPFTVWPNNGYNLNVDYTSLSGSSLAQSSWLWGTVIWTIGH